MEELPPLPDMDDHKDLNNIDENYHSNNSESKPFKFLGEDRTEPLRNNLF